MALKILVESNMSLKILVESNMSLKIRFSDTWN
jgi:hypothetical protein